MVLQGRTVQVRVTTVSKTDFSNWLTCPGYAWAMIHQPHLAPLDDAIRAGLQASPKRLPSALFYDALGSKVSVVEWGLKPSSSRKASHVSAWFAVGPVGVASDSMATRIAHDRLDSSRPCAVRWTGGKLRPEDVFMAELEQVREVLAAHDYQN